ncbi:MAG TPA: hypothetical protein P5186_11560 [Candidatus Paceibacterota bacterium]|nr:hypothetical protein [Candidatus Paceibacterota bacterium]HRZ99845.1 hypothetical protein [Candidatus Paceibacterota bacterium]
MLPSREVGKTVSQQHPADSDAGAMIKPLSDAVMSDPEHIESDAGEAGAFCTTHWSVVLRAGQSDDSRVVEALEKLCRTYWQPLSPEETPDRAFDRQWALLLLATVLDRLRLEYAAAGRENLFVGLKDTLAGGRSEIPYRELARRMDMSEGAVKVAAHRLRQRYRDLLRAVIADTVARPEEVEEELQELFAVLGG